MRECIKRKGHRKTYREIQEESISKILREIISEIQTVEFCTIAADRSQTCPTYRSCLRWDLDSHDELLGLHSTESNNSYITVKVLKEILMKIAISTLSSKIRRAEYLACLFRSTI